MNLLHRIFRKFLRESGIFFLLWKIPTLRQLLWKYFAQPGEFYFHRDVGGEFRLSSEFKDQTSEFFKKNGFSEHAFEGKNVLDIGAGSRLRCKYFVNAQLYIIEPLAAQFTNLQQSDLLDAKEVISKQAEERVDHFQNRFSFVMCLNVLDHCYDERKVLENIHFYLEENGIFLLSVDLHETKDPMHPISVSEDRLDKLLSECRFETISRSVTAGEFTHDQTATYKLRKISA